MRASTAHARIHVSRCHRTPRVAVALAVLLSSMACDDGPTSQPTSSDARPRTEALGQKLSGHQFDILGAGVYEGPAVTVEDVLSEPRGFAAGSTLRVEGSVVAVDPEGGAWMELGAPGRVLRVAWARAGAVPPSVVGRTALVEGELATVDERPVLRATGAALRK